MRKFLSTFFLLFVINTLQAVQNYAYVYPPIMQTIQETLVYGGDRHGDFRGDYVVALSDGSLWKVHPNDRLRYESWFIGDQVHVSVRTDFYWFKREHKFLLNNDSRPDAVKVMLVGHKQYPPLKIAQTKTYYKSESPHYEDQVSTSYDNYGNTKTKVKSKFVGYKGSDPRKVLILSDGSCWVVKEHLNDYQVGMNVYIGVQGDPTRFYDYVIISGDEREATWGYARAQK